MRTVGGLGCVLVLCVLLTGCLVPFDFDADGKADVAYYLQDGTWWELGAAESFATTGPVDWPVAGDYNGDGRWAPAAIIEDGRWDTGDAGIIEYDPRPPDADHHWMPVPGNYDGGRATEPAWFDAATARWFIRGRPDPVVFGHPDPIIDELTDVPVPADYDGDGYDDLAVYRPSDRSFYVQGQGKVSALVLGHPVPADYDGDGDDDPAVYQTIGGSLHVAGQEPIPWVGGEIAAPANYTSAAGDEFATVDADWVFTIEGMPGVPFPDDGPDGWGGIPAAIRPWYVATILQLTYLQTCIWEQNCDFGVPYDFDRDGYAELAYVTDDGRWFQQDAAAPFFTAGPLETDIVAPGDYSGAGVWLPAVIEGGTWSGAGGEVLATYVPNGVNPADLHDEGKWVPVPTDYNGDLTTDPAWFRVADATWFIQGQEPVTFGRGGLEAGGEDLSDRPVPADYDGDGDADLAVFRAQDGEFYVQGEGLVATLSPGYPAVGDFDGDGDDDPAVFRDTSSTWFFDGEEPDEWLGLSPDEWSMPAVADYDGDGEDDRVVLHQGGGDDGFWIEGAFEEPIEFDAGYVIPAVLPPWVSSSLLTYTFIDECLADGGVLSETGGCGSPGP